MAPPSATSTSAAAPASGASSKTPTTTASVHRRAIEWPELARNVTFLGQVSQKSAHILAAPLPLAQRLRFIWLAESVDSPFPALRVDA
jgi:hypothetical protein